MARNISGQRGGTLPPPGRQRRPKRRRFALAFLIVPLSAIPIVAAILAPEWFDHDGNKSPPDHPFPDLGFALVPHDGQYVVGAIEANGPASGTGIRTGDRVLSVDGVEIETALTRSSRELGCDTWIEYVSSGKEQSVTYDRCRGEGNVGQ